MTSTPAVSPAASSPRPIPQGSEVTARVFVGDSQVYTLAGTYPQGEQIPGLDPAVPRLVPAAGRNGGGWERRRGPCGGCVGTSGLNNTGSRDTAGRRQLDPTRPGSSARRAGGPRQPLAHGRAVARASLRPGPVDGPPRAAVRSRPLRSARTSRRRSDGGPARGSRHPGPARAGTRRPRRLPRAR